jgi:uncharacterized protein
VSGARVAYADLDAQPLVGALERALGAPDDRDAAGALAALLFPLGTSPTIAIAELVLDSEGPFAQLARRGIDYEDRRLRLAARELDALGALAHGPIARVLDEHGLRDAVPSAGAGEARPPAYAELRADLAAAAAWGELVDRLSAFHLAEGTGEVARHRVLRLGERGLVGVRRPDPISLADLEGGEAQQAPLRRDLEAFIGGHGANDALLYGPPGTGKSATVRGLASVFADRGLRLVQVDRGEIERLGSVFAQLAGRGPHCLVYLDDLAFDDGGRTDRVLRAALEGGVVERPANVLVWVTSNRLRLTRETHAERADDVEGRLAVGEKTALATRFGRRVAFRAPSQETYLAICRRLVGERLGTVPEGTEEAAIRFAVAGHGMTQRTARQFAGAFRTEELTGP